MKNIIIFCLINNINKEISKQLSKEVSYNYLDLTQILDEFEINSKTDLNKVAQNLDIVKISKEQLEVISNVKNTVFVCNNFNLLSEKFLKSLKDLCYVVYISLNKNDYLEFKWSENLTKPSKFKLNDKVFEMRQKAYISCVDVSLSYNKNVKNIVKKLISKLEAL